MSIQKNLEQSLKLLEEFREKAYTKDIEYELGSIEKYYRIMLYSLRNRSGS